MGRAPVTIYDIAYRAGVSQATVSRVLTGNARVSPEKRDAVMSAIKELNYKPNVVAQGLARGRSRAIGVLALTTVNPFYGRIIQGLEQELRSSGYRPLLSSVAAAGNADEAIDLLLESQIDGLIVVGGPIAGGERLRLAADDIPFAAYGPTIAGLEPYFVHANNHEGAITATRHLLALGHRRIALLNGPADHPHAIDRLTGFRAALAEAGLEPRPELMAECRFDQAEALITMDALLDRSRDFTALFAASDQLAYGALVSLHHHGLRVPQDVSVIGFDDQPQAAFIVPPLTTIAQPLLEMGAALARMVLSRLGDDENAPAYQPPEFETRLVERESTAPPRTS